MISGTVVKGDVYSSIHIDEFEIGASDTKLGPEEITRDIPNVSEEALRNLGPDGVVRVGAEIKPGDILVGKITPKSETELAPEERLLRAIFGEKAADVQDTPLTGPSSTIRHRFATRSAKSSDTTNTSSASSNSSVNARWIASKAAMISTQVSSSRSKFTSPRNGNFQLATKWRAVTETKASSRALFQKKTCRSWRVALQSRVS